ncbi:GNAT family N-acetyltransferase [Sphaerisporangium dianthi]|uniref:GNAT family N-acetyltransferase n=1 Tax=Sphaerisporangium dianthi TaxID=1436120 RepID=A0ABV9CRI6_9ACTN
MNEHEIADDVRPGAPGTVDDAFARAFEIRRPGADDAPAVYEVVSACDTEVLGHPDMTPDDVADVLAEQALDLERDAWLAYRRGGDGGPVGWAYALRQGEGGTVEVEVCSTDAGVTARLWDAVLGRAREIAAERAEPAALEAAGHAGAVAGHAGAAAEVAIYRQDEAKRALAAAYGFEPATSFHRLRADHAEVDEGSLPGVTVRAAAGSDDLMRAAHRIHQEGFAEHFGFVPKQYDRWKRDFESSSTHDWSQLLLAEVDGVPAAMLLGSDMFAADENCGYVRILSVLPGFRGRGLGRLLLKRAFAADARRGRTGTYLHVDAGNTTPALDLYLSVGMRPVLAIDVWRRAL